MRVPTYDLLNVGPRNRFVADNALVHNCTGAGPQPTNLPKAGPKVVRCGWDGKTQFQRGCGRHHGTHVARCPWCGVEGPPGRSAEWNYLAAQDALSVIVATRSVDAVEAVFGSAMLAVSGCLRGLFTAAKGLTLVASDYSAIEAVVIAALAGEKWRMDVFRDKRDIYLESISRSTGTPVSEMLEFKARTGSHHPLRAKGKIQELALGFLGWIGALRAFGAEGTDDELKQQVLAWRAASPAIVELAGGQTRDFGRSTDYFGLEGAGVQAMLNPSTHQYVMRLDGTWTGASYLLWENVLYLTLPSGRHLAYHQPKLSLAEKSWRGYRLTFHGWNTNPKKGVPGWIQMDLYAGTMVENLVQATARDIQRRSLTELEANGYPVVLHVYDEDVSETTRDVAGLEAIMSTMPPWAEGWPIRASGGWSGLRYRKD